MEELRRKFAEELYYKACDLAECDLEEKVTKIIKQDGSDALLHCLRTEKVS